MQNITKRKRWKSSACKNKARLQGHGGTYWKYFCNTFKLIEWCFACWFLVDQVELWNSVTCTWGRGPCSYVTVRFDAIWPHSHAWSCLGRLIVLYPIRGLKKIISSLYIFNQWSECSQADIDMLALQSMRFGILLQWYNPVLISWIDDFNWSTYQPRLVYDEQSNSEMSWMLNYGYWVNPKKSTNLTKYPNLFLRMIIVCVSDRIRQSDLNLLSMFVTTRTWNEPWNDLYSGVDKIYMPSLTNLA